MRVQIRKRHPVSPKDVRKANDAVERRFGLRPVPEDRIVETADADAWGFLLVKGFVMAVVRDPSGVDPYPGLRAIMTKAPERGHVTVDMGAVPFVVKGADVMAPGITQADHAIQPGDLVWIRDERHGRPLAIGSASATGHEMEVGTKGKVIKILHYVGDEIWAIGDV